MTELYSTKTLVLIVPSFQMQVTKIKENVLRCTHLFQKLFDQTVKNRFWPLVCCNEKIFFTKISFKYPNILYCFRYLISFQDVQAGHQITKSHSNGEEKDINFWKLEERITSSAD